MGEPQGEGGLMRRHFFLWSGLAILFSMFALGLFSFVIPLERAVMMDLPASFAGPSFEYPLGRDENGGDVFAKVIYGARISLGVAFLVVVLSASLGLILGSIAGYGPRWIDTLLMRVIDIFYAFPSFLLALALVAFLGPSLFNLIFALSLTSWTGFARLVRGEVLHLKERDYVQSAKSLGASSFRIVVLHIWPNLVGLLVVQATFAMAGTIIAESGLSFLGLGAPLEIPTWGQLLNSGRRYLSDAPHIALFPGLAIMILVMGFNLLGDGLRDLLDPKRIDNS